MRQNFLQPSRDSGQMPASQAGTSGKQPAGRLSRRTRHRTVRAAGRFAFAAAISTTAAQAATIYDESVDGDLAFATQPLLRLAAGENVVTGTSHLFASGSGPGDDFDQDPFSFVVPSGLRVASISFGHETTLLAGIPITTVRFRLSDANQVPITTTPEIDLFGASPVAVFGHVTPVPDGLYRWDEASWGNHVSTASEWSYTVTFDVVPVPEPGTLGLLAGGLAVLGLIARLRPAR
ncbi:MAG: PEP-CTERM sorting domain-containing protein [Betaproteobacteria bacterium]|nr:PEP-CTERM sorting domain-containing protein [Betaproteobacteria bacterium]